MSPEAGSGDVILDVGARRSSSVLIMAFGLMTVLGLLVVVNVAMVVRAIRLRKVEFTTLAALAATLFAIPGIRNGMPNYAAGRDAGRLPGVLLGVDDRRAVPGGRGAVVAAELGGGAETA